MIINRKPSWRLRRQAHPVVVVGNDRRGHHHCYRLVALIVQAREHDAVPRPPPPPNAPVLHPDHPIHYICPRHPHPHPHLPTPASPPPLRADRAPPGWRAVWLLTLASGLASGRLPALRAAVDARHTTHDPPPPPPYPPPPPSSHNGHPHLQPHLPAPLHPQHPLPIVAASVRLATTYDPPRRRPPPLAPHPHHRHSHLQPLCRHPQPPQPAPVRPP